MSFVNRLPHQILAMFQLQTPSRYMASQSLTTGVNLTNNGFFSHKTNIFNSSSHLLLRSSSSISKFHNSLARINLISAYAKLPGVSTLRPSVSLFDTYFTPIQFLGPTLNGANAPLLSALYLSSPNHLSGTNESGSLQLLFWRCAEYHGTTTVVPPETHCPLIIAPSGGTTLGPPLGAGGSILNASSMTASSYFNEFTDTMVISSSDLNAVRISEVSLERTSGYLHRKNVNAERRDAVVSEPATRRIANVAFISSFVMPVCRNFFNFVVLTCEGLTDLFIIVS